MATVAASADQAAGLLQNFSLDSQPKSKSNLDLPDQAKKAPPSQNGAVDSKDATNGHMPSNDRCITPVLPDIMDPSICYLPNAYQHTAYYYGGYDGTCNEWDDYSRYMNQEGVEMQTAVYGDNSSYMYHGYGYAPYGPYSPATSPTPPPMGHDNQLYGHQQYQYPTPYFSPVTPATGTCATPVAPHQGEVSSAMPAPTPLSVETANNNVSTVANTNGKGPDASVPFRPGYQNSSFSTNGSYARGGVPGAVPTSGYQDPRFAFDGMRSPVPWIDGPYFSDGQPRPAATNSFPSSVTNANGTPSSRNQNLRPHANAMGLHQPRPISVMGAAHGYANRMYPSPTKVYGHYGNGVRTGMGFGTGGYDARVNGRAWYAVDNKFKNKGRGNGFYGYDGENNDGLNELNRGPRSKGLKTVKTIAPVTLAVRGQSIQSNGSHDEKANLNSVPEREQYNSHDFPDSYTEAKFFVIKSYSEDDIHKSIKYNVWSSTPNGNKKLDQAYREAQEKSSGCPVFLFFSVNASGQFVGLAEMVGPVDFQKNVEYWQQDKWNGHFPVKWHIVKDVPNNMLKHIILENNENKPVTNSRDTQEIKLEQGLQMLKLFKEHTSKTCILDDFGFYEVRQKTIQEKKAKQQQYHKQVWEGKTLAEKSKAGGNGDQPLQKSVESAPDSVKETTPLAQSNGEPKISDASISKDLEAGKGSKPVVSDNGVVVNGVAKGC